MTLLLNLVDNSTVVAFGVIFVQERILAQWRYQSLRGWIQRNGKVTKVGSEKRKKRGEKERKDGRRERKVEENKEEKRQNERTNSGSDHSKFR